MATHNSLDSKRASKDIYLEIYCDLYRDIADMLNVPNKESRRDLETVRDRFLNEGVSFLTKTLPSLGKAFDIALQGDGPMSAPSTFSRCKARKVPNLFRYLFTQVIGTDSCLRVDANTECIKQLRELLYFMYKLEIKHTASQERKLLDEFVCTDEGLPSDLPMDDVLRTASRVIDSIFWNFDFRDVFPKHGPGSVATGEKSWQKHQFKRLYRAIDRVYPFDEYNCFSLGQVVDTYREFEKLESLESGTAKVVLVPKDSRGPRIISCEPLEYQWIQQGLGNAFVRHLETNRWTRGHVNFTDQRVNQQLALKGSLTQQWSTLDMKEASDRVSIVLVEKLFSGQPGLLDALMATRSTHTKLPDGRIVHMKKFAPMGSNLCFPVESICFWALSVAAIMHDTNMAGSFPERGSRGPHFHEAYDRARRLVFVYGDDIIVAREFTQALLQYLPKVGLLFNPKKCCTKGFFRESCGVDAFKGVIVTPLRMKKEWRRHIVDASALSSWCDFSNHAYSRGYKRVAVLSARLLESWTGPLPVVNRKQDCLAFVRPVSTPYAPIRYPRRFNKDLQRVEYRAYVIRPTQKRVGSDSWSMILRVARLGLSEHAQPSGVTQAGIFAVPRRSRLKRGWTEIT